MHPVVSEVRADLARHVDPAYKEGSLRFFKEPVKLWGVRARDTDRIERERYREVRGLEKKALWKACEALLASGKNEEQAVAFGWAFRRKREFEQSDFGVFAKWLEKYVSNWASCDDLCTHALGELLVRFTGLVQKTVPWRKSKNRWMKRASAVCLIPLARKGMHHKDAFSCADELLADTDDLVQKGYGWLLKEASNADRKAVFGYVMKRKARMPRTALRYAIEKMPSQMRAKAMAK